MRIKPVWRTRWNLIENGKCKKSQWEAGKKAWQVRGLATKAEDPSVIPQVPHGGRRVAL